MQNVIVEKPYRFVPPDRGTFWVWLFQKFRLYEPHLRNREGVVSHECRHVERLQESLAAGHGILLAPNHCRTADPLVLGFLAKEAGTHLYCMASWHLFHQSRLMSWVMPRMGAFSVNREGIDRQAINTAMEILETAERPLVLFPEGAASRNNDHLHALLDISFLARGAAKKRARLLPGGQSRHPSGGLEIPVWRRSRAARRRSLDADRAAVIVAAPAASAAVGPGRQGGTHAVVSQGNGMLWPDANRHAWRNGWTV